MQKNPQNLHQLLNRVAVAVVAVVVAAVVVVVLDALAVVIVVAAVAVTQLWLRKKHDFVAIFC